MAPRRGATLAIEARRAERTQAAAPNEPKLRRRTNPSRGAERTQVAAPNEPKPRRRTNPNWAERHVVLDDFVVLRTNPSRGAERTQAAAPNEPKPSKMETLRERGQGDELEGGAG